jgi:hypothetical protein
MTLVGGADIILVFLMASASMREARQSSLVHELNRNRRIFRIPVNTTIGGKSAERLHKIGCERNVNGKGCSFHGNATFGILYDYPGF